MRVSIEKVLKEHNQTILKLLDLKSDISKTGELIVETLKKGNKILIAGNGGSASDSQHFSAELTGRFLKKRQSLAAISLTTDTSAITAIANDYGYENVFLRQLSGLARPGDMFIGISTSGNSESINLSARFCQDKDISSIGLLGRDGGEGADIFDHSVIVPSDSTAHIQESHILIIHIWCMMIDESF
jgi:D-sedoheptulose 7-phosphate isomerase|tara:strand:- start:285 stop:845 length:561 start_codon:yes stop_codon:yes gene_type:complete